MNSNRFPPLARLAGAIVTALASLSAGHANMIIVNESCPLDKAIDTANFDFPIVGCDAVGRGPDTIFDVRCKSFCVDCVVRRHLHRRFSISVSLRTPSERDTLIELQLMYSMARA